jgi:hypothetical protein
MADVFGNQFLTAEPELIMNLYKDEPSSKVIEFSILKNRYEEEPAMITLNRTSNLDFVDGDDDGFFKGADIKGLLNPS